MSHDHISLLLCSIAVLLLGARVLGEIARRLRQPAVLGEILAGILLGPTVFGRVWPSGFESLFPASGPVAESMGGLTALAISMFLLVAGMEVDLSMVWRQRLAALTVGAGGIIAPMAIAGPIALASPAFLGIEDGQSRLVFALFVATAMAITALPVIAKILMDLQLFRTDLGMTVIAAAVFNDLVGWIIFALILAMLGQSSWTGMGVGWSMACALAFALLMLTVVRRGIDRLLPWIHAHLSWPGGVLGFALVLGLGSAALTEWLGVHAVFGAFICGVALGDSRHLRAQTRETIEQFVSFIFAPLFFASIGLRVDFAANFDLFLVTVILLVATLGKVGGCLVASRFVGFNLRDCLIIGFGMNARGAMEIILGLLAMEAGLIGERLFVALVVMALVTSLAAGVVIQALMGRRCPIQFWTYASARTFVPRLNGETVADVLTELSHRLAGTGVDPAAVLQAALSRELIRGSGLGNGVAVPHARIDTLPRALVAIGRSTRGVDFDARDGTFAKLIILIVTPTNDTETQLQLLASIARVCATRDVVDRLLAAETWTEFLAVLNTQRDERESRQGSGVA